MADVTKILNGTLLSVEKHYYMIMLKEGRDFIPVNYLSFFFSFLDGKGNFL